jgi:periplasmic protein TonB
VKRGSRLLAWVYGGSAVFHAALAVAAYFLPKEHKVESVAIELADIKKKNEKPKPVVPLPPPPPPPTEKPKPPPPPKEKAKLAPEAPKEAPAPEPLGADGFADLEGVSLGNGVGGGSGDGVAIGAPGGAAGPAVGARTAAVPVTRKVQALAAAAAQECNEPEIRPKHLTQILPKMTHAAQVAEIEGVVRVEVTVDESGRVIAARVVSGLGYGLDEEALRAAKAWTFHPATRCGRHIIGHTVIPFRFSLT